jgi:hypothetical protein
MSMFVIILQCLALVVIIFQTVLSVLFDVFKQHIRDLGLM